jgi:hypothetical protein
LEFYSLGFYNVKLSCFVLRGLSLEELEQMQKVLEESIANILEKDQKDVKLTIDPKTGKSTYEISAADESLAEEIQKIVKGDDFAKNVNIRIGELKKNLPQRIQEGLEITDVKPGETVDVKNYFF